MIGNAQFHIQVVNANLLNRRNGKWTNDNKTDDHFIKPPAVGTVDSNSNGELTIYFDQPITLNSIYKIGNEPVTSWNSRNGNFSKALNITMLFNE